MRLIKFEKQMCGNCNRVEAFLNGNNVQAEHIDVESYSDLDFISKYVTMTLPVVVLLDDDGSLVKKSEGFNPPELEEIISLL
jgi:thioredoxin 1